MKHLSKYLVLPMLVVGLLLPSQLRAQKPVAVISISGVDELMGDIKFLAEQAGAPGGAQLLEGIITPFIQGLDRTKPIGVVVSMTGGAPQPLAFIPVKNFGTLLGLVEQQLGQAEDAGNGIKKLTVPGAAIFIKDQNGFAFISQSPAALAKLPANPLTLLGGLDKKYDLAVQGNMKSLPPQMKALAVSAVEQGMQAGLQQRPGESDEQYQLRKSLAQMQLNDVKELIQELETASLGFAIDRKAKQVYFDISITAAAGSKLARQAAALKKSTSKFGGFLLPNAAVTMNLTSPTTKEDVDQLTKLMALGRQQALTEIENDGSIPAAVKDKVKGILEDVIGVATATLKTGRIDGGAAVILEPQAVKFAAGGLISDGKKLDKAFRDLVDLAKQEPDFPEVKFDVAKHSGVSFHSITVPVPDDEARRFLGDKVEVVIAIGDSSFFVAFGKDSQSLVKQVIDQSASRASDTVPPVQLNFALGPILKFASTVENNPMIATLSGLLAKSPGKDRIRMTAETTENGRGVRYRFLVDEGIIKLLGAGAAVRGGGL